MCVCGVTTGGCQWQALSKKQHMRKKERDSLRERQRESSRERNVQIETEIVWESERQRQTAATETYLCSDPLSWCCWVVYDFWLGAGLPLVHPSTFPKRTDRDRDCVREWETETDSRDRDIVPLLGSALMVLLSCLWFLAWRRAPTGASLR
jgi:hypothetical protein